MHVLSKCVNAVIPLFTTIRSTVASVYTCNLSLVFSYPALKLMIGTCAFCLGEFSEAVRFIRESKSFDIEPCKIACSMMCGDERSVCLTNLLLLGSFRLHSFSQPGRFRSICRS